MTDERQRCPQCGAAHGGAADEPCPACLLRLGLEGDVDTTSDPVTSSLGSDGRTSAGEKPPMPDRVGDWRPVRLLGEGGMGVVYLAEETGPLKRQAALKRIKHGLDSKRVLARFDQERRVLARMDHPGIARVLDAGAAEDGTPYFVMEYVDGLPITEYCDRQRSGPRERLGLFLRLCEAVEHAHRRGILHRDLKPSNILVVETADGPQPKVIDFGVARATAQRRMEWSVFTEFGRLVGTPEYMSPEQADLENDDLDTRSDVYALGVVLYELLVGSTPHDGRSLRALGLEALLKTIREGSFQTPSSRLSTLGDEAGEIAERRGSDPERLRRGIAGELDWIVMRATDRERERRYGSPHEMAEDVRRHLGNLPVLAGPPGIFYRMRKFVRRHRAWVALGGAAMLALLVGVVGLSIGLDRALDAEQAARRAEERAKDEETRAQATSDFLVSLFREAGPDNEPIHELKALDALNRGAERIQDRFEDEPLLRARILHALGRTYEDLELFDRARPLLEEALELHREHSEPGDPRLAHSYFMIGVLQIETGDYRGSIPYFEKAVELLDASDRDPPRAVASPLRSLGNALRTLGELEGAEAAHRRAVDVAREHREEDPGLYGITLDNLAGTLMSLQRYEEAEGIFLEAIEAHRSWGPQSISTAQAIQNLGILYLTWHRYPEAEERAREAVEIYTHVFGEDHVRPAYARLLLTNVLRITGQTADAASLIERDLTLFEDSLGPAHPRTTTARLALSSIYRGQERYDDARALMERQIELLGNNRDDPSVASAYVELASIHWASKNYEGALAAREKAEFFDTERLGPSHPDVAVSIAIQGWCLRKLGRLDEAYERLDRSLTILRASDLSLPENRLNVCDNLDGFARLHADMGNHQEATEMFEELTATLTELKGADYAPLAELYGEYARSLRALGREEEALVVESRTTP